MADASNLRSESVQRLLEPSLSAGAAVSLYSARACFLTAFFGGPIAALAMGWLNARLLKRQSKDVWVVVLLGAALLAFDIYFISSLDTALQQANVLGLTLERRDARRVHQGLGLLFFLAVYLRHRPFHRAMAFAGAPPLKPWKAAILVALVSGVLQAGLIGLLLMVLR